MATTEEPQAVKPFGLFAQTATIDHFDGTLIETCQKISGDGGYQMLTSRTPPGNRAPSMKAFSGRLTEEDMTRLRSLLDTPQFAALRSEPPGKNTDVERLDQLTLLVARPNEAPRRLDYWEKNARKGVPVLKDLEAALSDLAKRKWPEAEGQNVDRHKICVWTSKGGPKALKD